MTGYRLKAYFFLLIATIIWGVAGPIIKFTLQGLEPFPFLGYRFFISAVIGVIALIIAKPSLENLKKNSCEIILYSLLSTSIPLALLFVALKRSTVLDVTLITAVSPLIVALAGAVLLKEHITNREKLGMAVAFIGSLITIIQPILNPKTDFFQLSGNLLVIGYLLANSTSSVLAKKLTRNDVNSLDLANISFIVGFLSILPIILLLNPIGDTFFNIRNLALEFHFGVIYMAVFSGTIAYALWIKGQKSIEVSEAGLFYYLTPVFSAPIAIFWLKETITPPYIIGAILITLGVIIAELKKSRKE